MVRRTGKLLLLSEFTRLAAAAEPNRLAGLMPGVIAAVITLVDICRAPRPGPSPWRHHLAVLPGRRQHFVFHGAHSPESTPHLPLPWTASGPCSALRTGSRSRRHGNKRRIRNLLRGIIQHRVSWCVVSRPVRCFPGIHIAPEPGAALLGCLRGLVIRHTYPRAAAAAGGGETPPLAPCVRRQAAGRIS